MKPFLKHMDLMQVNESIWRMYIGPPSGKTQRTLWDLYFWERVRFVFFSLKKNLLSLFVLWIFIFFFSFCFSFHFYLCTCNVIYYYFFFHRCFILFAYLIGLKKYWRLKKERWFYLFVICHWQLLFCIISFHISKEKIFHFVK